MICQESKRTEIDTQATAALSSILNWVSTKKDYREIVMTRNIGKLDRIFRFLLALLLLWLGLIGLQGLEGRALGIAVALMSVIPFATSTTASCFVFRWLNKHSLSKRECELYGDPTK
jgi:hypothetical protein